MVVTRGRRLSLARWVTMPGKLGSVNKKCVKSGKKWPVPSRKAFMGVPALDVFHFAGSETVAFPIYMSM